MGLTKDIILDNGIALPSAYHRIEGTTYSKHTGTLIITVISYVDREKALVSVNGEKVIKGRNYEMIPNLDEDAPNDVIQGYLFIREHPDFVDAVDVLEAGQTIKGGV